MILTNEQHYHDIADAIRGLTGSEDSYKPEQMAPAISAAAPSGSDGGLTAQQYRELIERTVTKVVIPQGTTTLGTDIFSRNLAMTEVVIPDSVTSVEYYAFWQCPITLESIPESITYLGDGAFRATNVALTKLPDNLASLGNYCFAECPNLKITDIPATVTAVGTGAFMKCVALEEITFHSTPTIGRNAFQNCTLLTTIRVPWSEGAVANAPWGASATIIYDYVEEDQ